MNPENPVTNGDGRVKEFFIRLTSGVFFCECGCNVFHKPDDKRLEIYKCNSCGLRFTAE